MPLLFTWPSVAVLLYLMLGLLGAFVALVFLVASHYQQQTD